MPLNGPTAHVKALRGPETEMRELQKTTISSLTNAIVFYQLRCGMVIGRVTKVFLGQLTLFKPNKLGYPGNLIRYLPSLETKTGTQGPNLGM